MVKRALALVSFVFLTVAVALGCSANEIPPPIINQLEAKTPEPLSTKLPTQTISPTRLPEPVTDIPTWEECAPLVIEFYAAVQNHRISLTEHRKLIAYSAEYIATEPENIKELKQELGASLIDHKFELDYLTHTILDIADNTPYECKMLYDKQIEYIGSLTFSPTAAKCRELDALATTYMTESMMFDYSNRMVNALASVNSGVVGTLEGFEHLGQVIIDNYNGLKNAASLGDMILCDSDEWGQAVLELQEVMQLDPADANMTYGNGA